jgi:hypothetical protein
VEELSKISQNRDFGSMAATKWPEGAKNIKFLRQKTPDPEDSPTFYSMKCVIPLTRQLFVP